MARPRKDGVDYFPHFVNWGKTIPILESKYGNDGYAVWFKLLEALGKSKHHFIDCSDPNEWEFLLSKLRVAEVSGAEMLGTLARLGAIDHELWTGCKVIWCQNFVDNLQDLYRKRHEGLPTRPEPASFRRGNDGTSGVSGVDNQQSTAQHSKAEERKGKKGGEGEQEEPDPPSFSEFVGMWNSLGGRIPKIRALTSQRRKHLRARMREPQFSGGMTDIIEKIRASSFLSGENDRGWAPTFDWVIGNEGNYVKVLEGAYDNRNGHGTPIEPPSR